MSRVFDAEGLPSAWWKEIMSSQRLWVAYGTTPCRAAGHRLRTRKGHCVQCNPAALAFLRRHDLEGTVYVAYSRKLRLVKVGCAECIAQREASLNADGYAGTSDWEIRYHAESDRAGKLEAKVHDILREHRYGVQYFRLQTESYVWANELFRCRLAKAKDALRAAIESQTTNSP